MLLCLICRFIHDLVFQSIVLNLIYRFSLFDLHLVMSLLLVSLAAVDLLFSNNLAVVIYLPYHDSALNSLSRILNVKLYLPIALLCRYIAPFEDRSNN